MSITRCGRKEVIVITGCCISDYKFVYPGSFALALPGQKLQRLSLDSVTVHVRTEDVITKSGIPIFVMFMAQAKINRYDEALLRTACEKLLGKSREEVKQILHDCIAVCQRTAMANFTPEDCVSQRKKISQAVFDEASKFTVEFGMSTEAVSIKDCGDFQGYFKELGRPRREEVMRQAGLLPPKEEQKNLEELKLQVEKEEQEMVEDMRQEEDRGAGKMAVDKIPEEYEQRGEMQPEEESGARETAEETLRREEKLKEEMKLLVEREAQEVMEEMRLEEEREARKPAVGGKWEEEEMEENQKERNVQ